MRCKETYKSRNNFQATIKQFNKIYKVCFVKRLSKEPTLGRSKDRENLFIVNQHKVEEGIIFRLKTTVCVRKVVYFIRCRRSAWTISKNRHVVRELGAEDDYKFSVLLTRIEQNEDKLSMTGKRRYLGKAKGPLLKFAGLWNCAAQRAIDHIKRLARVHC